jgi:haloacid dehalogenase-like hydrolase
VDTVVFDKTDTLTVGIPEVTSIPAADGDTVQEVLEIASIAEQRPGHPLAKAILNKAAESQLEISAPEEFKYAPGKGADCRLDHRRILVGSKAFPSDNNVVLNGAGSSGNPWSEILVACNGVYSVVSCEAGDSDAPVVFPSRQRLHLRGRRPRSKREKESCKKRSVSSGGWNVANLAPTGAKSLWNPFPPSTGRRSQSENVVIQVADLKNILVPKLDRLHH